MKYKVGDYCYCVFSKVKIDEVVDGQITSIILELTGSTPIMDNDSIFPDTPDIKGISEGVDVCYHNVLDMSYNTNRPVYTSVICHKYNELWIEMCKHRHDKRVIGELQKYLHRFTKEVLDAIKTNDGDFKIDNKPMISKH